MIGRITILRSTVFAGVAVGKGDVLDVPESEQSAAYFLIRTGKAIEGTVSGDDAKANGKAVSTKDIEKK